MGKRIWPRLWHFLWEEDSVASWIANVVVAFVVIKFAVYPGLGFVLGTTHPIVAVVSGSMEHDESMDQWWSSPCAGKTQAELYQGYGISREQFGGFGFRNGFDKGDIMVVADGSDPSVGDVIIYTIPEQAEPIIHRVVEVSGPKGHKVYKTKGDHNCGTNPFEEQIEAGQIVGKAQVRVPWLGWVKLVFIWIVSLVAGLIPY